MILDLKVIRSTTAEASLGSGKISFHSENGKFVEEVREIEPGTGEFYDPSADTEMLARYARDKAERDTYYEKHHADRYGGSSPGSGKGQSEGRSSGGYGKSY